MLDGLIETFEIFHLVYDIPEENFNREVAELEYALRICLENV